jgi:hypothetical protein
MVSNCANPECSVPLRYLRDGRLYQFEVKSVASPSYDRVGTGLQNKRNKKPSRQVWHYWLCGQCCSTMTLAFDQLEGLKLIPAHHHVSRVPAEECRLQA